MCWQWGQYIVPDQQGDIVALVHKTPYRELYQYYHRTLVKTKFHVTPCFYLETEQKDGPLNLWDDQIFSQHSNHGCRCILFYCHLQAVCTHSSQRRVFIGSWATLDTTGTTLIKRGDKSYSANNHGDLSGKISSSWVPLDTVLYRRLWAIRARSDQQIMFMGSWVTPPTTSAIQIKREGKNYSTINNSDLRVKTPSFWVPPTMASVGRLRPFQLSVGGHRVMGNAPHNQHLPNQVGGHELQYNQPGNLLRKKSWSWAPLHDLSQMLRLTYRLWTKDKKA